MASIVEFENPPTPEAFRHAMEANGVAKISALLPAQTLADLRTVVDRSYAAIDGRIARRADRRGACRRLPALERDQQQLVGPCWRPTSRTAPRWSTFCPRSRPHLRRCSARSWRLCPEVSWFRCHNDEAKFVAWHIDADAARRRIRITSINMWLPLTSASAARPPARIPARLPSGHARLSGLGMQRALSIGGLGAQHRSGPDLDARRRPGRPHPVRSVHLAPNPDRRFRQPIAPELRAALRGAADDSPARRTQGQDAHPPDPHDVRTRKVVTGNNLLPSGYRHVGPRRRQPRPDSSPRDCAVCTSDIDPATLH